MARVTEYRGITALTLVILIWGAAGFGRTIIVAADGSGDFAHIWEAAEIAVAGDSILVRDGDYYDEEFSIDSAVVVFAENHGAARIWGEPGSEIIVLRGGAELIGFQILGNFLAIFQVLLRIENGPGVIYNCEFLPAARFGLQLSILSRGFPPSIRHCRFYLSGSSHIADNYDSTDIWMPDNYYGTLDTAMIHLFIWDGQNDPELGFVTISPVADTFEWLGVEPRPLPNTFALHQNYPNPFNGSTRIAFDLPKAGPVTLRVYDLLGREVATLVDGVRVAGQHSVLFDGSRLASGIYFYRLEAGGGHEVKKMVLLK